MVRLSGFRMAFKNRTIVTIEHVWIPTVLTFRRNPPTSEPSRSALEAAESELWKIVHSVATTATTAPAAPTATTATTAPADPTAPTAPADPTATTAQTVRVKGKG